MLPIIQKYSTIQFIIGAGPLYRGKEIPCKNARWFYRPDLSQYWKAFDFVIAAGGFNSVNELLVAQIPTLFFAQNRLYDDQLSRVLSLEEQGLCLHFNKNDTADIIRKKISQISQKKIQEQLRSQLHIYQAQNEANEAALGILALHENAITIERITTLLDIDLLYHFKEQGLTERIICKTIVGLYNFKKQRDVEDALIDEQEIIDKAHQFLTMVVQSHASHKEILPLLFTITKNQSILSLEELYLKVKNKLKQKTQLL